MADVDVHIWHDASGEVIAVGRPMGKAKCVPVSGNGESVLATVISEEAIAGLHHTHFVDAAQGKLIKGSPAAKMAGKVKK